MEIKILNIIRESKLGGGHNETANRILLLPVVILTLLFLPVMVIPSYAVDPDIYEEDDIYSQANDIIVDVDTQQHTFHDIGDEDWVRFYANEYEKIAITVTNAGSNTDAVIELFDTDGTTLIDNVNDSGKGGDENLEWTFLYAGIYYARIKQSDPNNFGVNTGYDLNAFRSAGGVLGFIIGTVTDENTNGPISGAFIRTNTNASATSLPDVAYIIIHQPGTFTITAEASGYESSSYPGVVVEEGKTVTQNISLTSIVGDYDGDGVEDGIDNCPTISNPSQADSDNDGYGNECDVFPDDESEWFDTDEDGTGNNADTDDDNDGGGGGGGCFISIMNL